MADIRRFGDALEGDLRAAFLNAIQAATQIIPDTQLEALIVARNIPALQALADRLAIEGFIEAAGPFLDVFESIFRSAGSSVLLAAEIPRISPRISTYLLGRPAFLLEGLARDITTSVRQTIAREITAGELNVPGIARQIRRSIGVLPAHELAIARYRDQMIEDGMSDAAVQRNADLYRTRLLNWRADMISRTETMTATHAGLLEGWKTRIESGLLLPERTWMEWVVTDDDRLCSRCAPMDGQRIRVGGEFEASVKGFPDGLPPETPRNRRRKGGLKPGSRRVDWRDTELDGRVVPLKKPVRVPHPPLHPHCRCTMRLMFDRNVTAPDAPQR